MWAKAVVVCKPEDGTGGGCGGNADFLLARVRVEFADSGNAGVRPDLWVYGEADVRGADVVIEERGIGTGLKDADTVFGDRDDLDAEGLGCACGLVVGIGLINGGEVAVTARTLAAVAFHVQEGAIGGQEAFDMHRESRFRRLSTR